MLSNRGARAQVQESGGAEVRRGVYVTSTEEAELSGSKGTAHFVMKFSKDSKRECSVTVQEVKGVTRAFTGASRLLPLCFQSAQRNEGAATASLLPAAGTLARSHLP